jgi:CubicO group peptidase (beta-lactamase class C family)
MASLTKPVATATALAVCMDRGLVDISAPFIQYLPEYQGKLQGTVTVQDLARHISGFDNRKPYLKGGHVIENLMYHSPVQPPKQKYEYACCNYILLGLIVERVSGKSLSRFCQETIFDPLGMRDTRWAPLLNPDIRRVVKPNSTPVLGVVNDEPARVAGRPIGNAGLFSTADDLAKFCQMMLANGRYGRNQLLSEKAMHALSVKTDTCSPVALGWRVDTSYNPPSLSEATLSHTGSTGNSIWIDPVQQCFVIVLTNRTGVQGHAQNARTELAEYLLKEMRSELEFSYEK